VLGLERNTFLDSKYTAPNFMKKGNFRDFIDWKEHSKDSTYTSRYLNSID
jgi:hypothetical protein